MRKTTFIITFLHLFSPISAITAKIITFITSLRFNVHETLQINQFNSLTSKREIEPWRYIFLSKIECLYY